MSWPKGSFRSVRSRPGCSTARCAYPQMIKVRIGNTGLGDRLGRLIISAAWGRLLNAGVLTVWDEEESEEQRSDPRRYRSDPRRYPSFTKLFELPSNVRLVSDQQWNASSWPMLNLQRGWRDRYELSKGHQLYTACEYVKECAYVSLVQRNWQVTEGTAPLRLVNLSYARYSQAYSWAAAAVKYKQRLHKPWSPPSKPFIAIHVRRGDKARYSTVDGDVNRADAQLAAVAQSLAHVLPSSRKGSEVPVLLIAEDQRAAFRQMLRSGLHVIRPPPNVSTTPHEQALLEFAALTRAALLIGSVPSMSHNFWSGWTAFSYMASVIGGAKLLLCVEPHTRVSFLQQLSAQPLAGVVTGCGQAVLRQEIHRRFNSTSEGIRPPSHAQTQR